MSSKLKTMLARHKTQDEILDFMAKNRINITEAMIYIRSLYGISLGEAKVIVSQSIYWSDTHHANQHLHNTLEDFAKVLGSKD